MYNISVVLTHSFHTVPHIHSPSMFASTLYVCFYVCTVCIKVDLIGLAKEEDNVICRTLVHIVSEKTIFLGVNKLTKLFVITYKSHFYSHS